ncbi:MAG: thiol protease/hemagglutinin PrtT [Bacteroidales bacterium]|nr:thiol protease/hemagglutinin PrtT [Bacteroidales bacterium]
MKKFLLLFIAFSLLTVVVNAKSISENEAKTVAQTHWKSVACLKDNNCFTSVYSSPELFIFNVQPQGFVIVAADNNVKPVLGYSAENSFNVNYMAPALKAWLQHCEQDIRYVVENNIVATEEIQKMWRCYLAGERSTAKFGKSVSPLVQTAWDQGCYYNTYCPQDDRGQCGHVWAGCPSIAMGQIMKYWSYPETGNGAHSYYDYYGYGEQSADFGATTYRWDEMPKKLNSGSSEEAVDAVATLVYHCGVATETVYHYNGSGAWNIEAENPICVESALKAYFDYKPTMQGRFKDDMTEEEWLNILISELDAARPMMCVGCVGPLPTDGGHTYVCDGYDSDEMFHFNWGWGGSGDGFFNIHNLNPMGYHFDYQQEVLYGIEPMNLPIAVTENDSYSITISPNPTNGKIHISKVEIANIEVLDINGKTINVRQNNNSIDLSNCISGIYFIKITSNDGKTIFKKVVKE